MTRYLYGGTADYALVAGDVDSDGLRAVRLKPAAELRLYSAPDGEGGTEHTDLLDYSGTPVPAGGLRADTRGAMPLTYGPDGVTIMYMSAGGGPRRAVQPVDAATLAQQAQVLAEQAQATAQAALAAAGSGGGSGGAVASVNGRTGNVVLSASDVAALPAGPGGIITIPPGDLTTAALKVRIPAGDRAAAVDTSAVELNVGTDAAPTWRRVFFVNEKGLPRIIAPTPTDVMFRIKLYGPEHSADAAQLTDLDNNPLTGIRADGRIYAPNVGNARISQGMSQPAAPSLGDLWVDRTASPPALKVWTGAQWVLAAASTGGDAPPPPPSAPDFVAATQGYINATSLTLTKPSGGTLIAMLAWNAGSAITAPSGWTLVSELVGASGRAGVWVAPADVANLTWSHGATSYKTSGMILGYEACNVAAVTEALETLADGVHTAPAITPPVAPSTLLRLWWDKASTTTTVTLPGGVTQRAVQYGTGSSSCAVAAADATLATTSTVPAADATFNANSAQAGGFSLVLVAA